MELVNLFYLDEDLDKNAEYHVDTHVVKMVTEATQLLTTTVWVDKFLGFIPRALTKDEQGIINEIKAHEAAISIDNRKITRFLPTHYNHPCSVWIRSSLDNFQWVFNYASALNSEYRFRYRHSHNHKSFDTALRLPDTTNLRSQGITKRPLCMPNEYKQEGSDINCYRMYYMMEKADFAVWKRRFKPPWWDEKFVEYSGRDPHQCYLNTIKAPTNRGKIHSQEYDYVCS
jgi:hypothetical protein